MIVSRIARNWLAAVVAASVALPAVAAADEIADFYRGKKITMMIGFGAGEAYDVYARTLARHMPKYLPGSPLFVPQNMPGAGSLNAANAIFNVAPRDGTAFGTTHRFVPLMPLLGVEGPKFDPLKFTYIGSMNRENSVCISWKGSGINTIDDAKVKEFTVGTTGAGAELTTFNATLTNLLGLKLKVVSGYRTSLEINLAIERGEVQGRCGVSYGSLKNTEPQWFTDDKMNFLIQLGLTKDPELPDVPLFGDLVTNPLDRAALKLMLAPAEIGRPFFGPPGIPAPRTAALRKAFDEALKDPDLIKEAKQQRLDISAVTGSEMEQLLADAYKSSDDVVARARELVAMGSK
ncbi:MAG: Bug family tripartite tricarboxylate transporter substrate binding protein [Gemmatimonas sp.]